MAKLAYPTTRPFVDYNKTVSYKVNRNSKFYKTLLEFRLSQLPIVELVVESHSSILARLLNLRAPMMNSWII